MHTTTNILAKLDSDLTDAVRKSYLNILLQSPVTAHLLTIVALEWKKKLLEQQLDIAKVKESIRIKTCYIDAHKEYPSSDSDEKIELMQKSIDQDTIRLNKLQAVNAVSAAHAEKSLILFGPALEELKLNFNEKWNMNP